MRSFLLTIFILLISSSSNANKIVKEIDSLVGMNQPYVLINLPSGDCINCKLNAFEALRTLCKEKIAIVSDDRQMKHFLQRTTDVADSVKFIGNKHLSDLLLIEGGKGSLCLVNKDTILKYPLDASFDTEKLNDVEKIINCNNIGGSGERENGRTSFKDSIINPSHSFFDFDSHQYYVFNTKFQAGLEAGAVLPKYYDFSIKKETEKKIHSLVARNTPKWNLLAIDDSSYAKSSTKVLKQTGLLNVNLVSFQVGSVFFYYNTCHSVPTGYDTLIDIRVGRKFIFSKSDNSFLSPNENQKMYFVPDISKKGKAFYALRYTSKGYQFKNNLLYLPAIKSDSTGQPLSDATLLILTFKVGKGEAVELEKIFDTKRKTDSISDFFMRLDDEGIPVIVNKNSRYVLRLKDHTSVTFAQLTGDSSTHYLYDISVDKNELKYLAVVSKSTVKGSYNIKTGMASSVQSLQPNKLFSDAVIHDKTIGVYMKNMDDDTLYFEKYAF
jgi:hypothetical protein